MRPSLILAVFLPYLLFAQSLKTEVSAASAILINAETGAILYEKNARSPCFPASTTKVATALYALSKKPGLQDEQVTAGANALGCVSPQVRRMKHPSYRLEFGGSHMGLKVGEELAYRDLLHGLLIISANDAANVIAEHVSGSVPTFMAELNQFLREKGIVDTYFSNPHGLPAKDHKTTAHDLAKMAQLAMQIPTFREIVKSVRYTKPASNKQPETVFVQTNALLKPGPHFYPKAIGVKTGYTVSAGQNLVAAAADENRSLIVVLLGCPDTHQRYNDAIALFEAAFNEKKMSRTVFAKGFDLFPHNIKGSKQVLQASLVEDFVIDYYPSEEPQFKATLHWDDLKLPIAQGARVGELRLVFSDGKVFKSRTLHAHEALDKTFAYELLALLQKLKIVMKSKIALLLLAAAFFGSLIFYVTKKEKKLLQS